MRSNNIPQDQSPIQEGDSPVKQIGALARGLKWGWQVGKNLFTKAPKKEIIKKTKVKKPKVTTKKVDTKTKKVDTKKVDTKKTDTKKGGPETIQRRYIKNTKEYRDLNKKLKEVEDKMKTLSPEKRTIAQNAWKWISRGGTAYMTYDIATYFLQQMGGEEIEIKDQALERDLGPQGGDPNNLILYNPHVDDSTDFSIDEATADEFISVD